MITRPTISTFPPWADSGDRVQPDTSFIASGFPHTADKPTRQTMNWILHYCSDGVQYFIARGLPDWAIDQSYTVGDVVRHANHFYQATANSLSQTPSASSSFWSLWMVTASDMTGYLTVAAAAATYLSQTTAAIVYATVTALNAAVQGLQTQIDLIDVGGGGGGGEGGPAYTAGAGIAISNLRVISNTAPHVQADWNAVAGQSSLILNRPNLATVATSGNYNDLTNRPNLAPVATSGAYNSLTGLPTIPAAQVNSDWNATSGVAMILNKPATVGGGGGSGTFTAGNDLSGTATSQTVIGLQSKRLAASVGNPTDGMYIVYNGTNYVAELSGWVLSPAHQANRAYTWVQINANTTRVYHSTVERGLHIENTNASYPSLRSTTQTINWIGIARFQRDGGSNTFTIDTHADQPSTRLSASNNVINAMGAWNFPDTANGIDAKRIVITHSAATAPAGSGNLVLMNNGAYRVHPYIRSTTGTLDIQCDLYVAGSITFTGQLFANNTNTQRINASYIYLADHLISSPRSGYVRVAAVLQPQQHSCGTASTFQDNNTFNIQANRTLFINGTSQGTITVSSDYRLKENIEAFSPASDVLSIVGRLRPVTFRYTDKKNRGGSPCEDGKLHWGFIAHEVADVLPGAVYGEKDAVTEDGRIQPQSLNPWDVIAALTRAVQELTEKVRRLEATA